MSRPFRAIAYVIALAVFIPTSIQYGRYALSYQRSRSHLNEGREALTAMGFTEDLGTCSQHPGRKLGRELELIETQMRVAGLFDEKRIAFDEDAWTDEEWARLAPVHMAVLGLIEHSGRPEFLRPGVQLRGITSWPWCFSRHLLIVGGQRALSAGDVELAGRSWGAALDAAWLQWTSMPNLISLFFGQSYERQVLTAIRPHLADAEVAKQLAPWLLPRLRTERWTDDDIHHAVRGEAAWLCAWAKETRLRALPDFEFEQLGGDGLKEALQFEKVTSQLCTVGVSDPESYRKSEDALHGGSLRTVEAIRELRSLALAHLLAVKQKEHVGVWPTLPEDIRDLDPGLAAQLVIERRPEGLVIAPRREAQLVTRGGASEAWILEPAVARSSMESH